MIQAIVGDIGACAKQLRKSECGIPDDVVTARINTLLQTSLDSLSFVILYGNPTRAVATSALGNLCTNLKFIVLEKQVLDPLLCRPFYSSLLNRVLTTCNSISAWRQLHTVFACFCWSHLKKVAGCVCTVPQRFSRCSTAFFRKNALRQ